MRDRSLVSVPLSVLVGACSSSGADVLTGTWDFPLDQTQAQLVVDDFAGLVGSAEAVVVRLGFDGSEYWQGFVFDGELFLLGGVLEGDGGPFEVEGDRIAMTGAHGDIRATCTWGIEDDESTLVWVEQCDLSSQSEDCTDDRSRIEAEDPFVFRVMEHTFTRSSDDPDY